MHRNGLDWMIDKRGLGSVDVLKRIKRDEWFRVNLFNVLNGDPFSGLFKQRYFPLYILIVK